MLRPAWSCHFDEGKKKEVSTKGYFPTEQSRWYIIVISLHPAMNNEYKAIIVTDSNIVVLEILYTLPNMIAYHVTLIDWAIYCNTYS